MKYKVKSLEYQNSGIPLCFVNSMDAKRDGFDFSDSVVISYKDKQTVYQVIVSNTICPSGYIVLPVSNVDLLEDDEVDLQIVSNPQSINSIREKFRGKRLNYDDSFYIMKDIADDRLGDIGRTYFASIGYSPGFDDDEIYNLTKAMANSGDVIDFNEEVVDKHSIGGVAGKGITPIVVSIVSSCGLIIPNTSTRSITTPAGTTDVLEVLMKVSYHKEEILKLVKDSGACMVWGGSLGLAPADDKLIRVEQILNLESYDKLLISIMAKKAATSIKYLELDLPVGLNSKVKHRKDIAIVKDKFEKLAYKLGIKIDIYERRPKGIDGNAVGPVLEAIEFMKVLEQRNNRSLSLEMDAVMISGRLLELCGKCKVGEGTPLALSKLQNLSALSKFREIMKNQEGNPNLTSDDIKLSNITKDYCAREDGKIESIINENLVRVTKVLGAPQIKVSGIFFHKNVGDYFKKGEKLMTLYSSSQSRLDLISDSDIAKIFN